MGQLIVPAGAGEDFDWSADHIYVKTPHSLTDGRATVVEDILKPGFHLARHHHRRMTEIFYVLAGAIVFSFDDEAVRATPGMTISIPPNVWHDVQAEEGGRLLTVFSPGGFETYLQELAAQTPQQAADAALQAELAQRYDIWTQ